MADLLYLNVPITKMEKQPDGTLLVAGPCTSDSLDADRQIVDQDWAESALRKWFDTGANIRYMHQQDVIGVGVDLQREGNRHLLTAKIVDDNAVKKFLHGALRAFSIGIANAKLDFRRNPAAQKGVICGGDVPEVSGVDRPSNPDSYVDIIKSAGGEQFFTGEIWAEDELTKCWCGCDDGEDVEKMSTAARNKLPDSAFGYIDPDGGRHFPIHDEKHVRLAVQLLSTSKYGPKARKKVMAAAKKYGIEVSDDGKTDGPKCSTCDGSGKIKDGNMDCPDCGGKGTVTKADKPQNDDPDDDGDDDTSESGDTDDDGAARAKAVGPEPHYVIKRLHDHLCWAYGPDVIAEEYPAAKSLPEALDPTIFQRAATEACKAENADGYEIAELGKAFGDALNLSRTDPAILADARASLHELFKADYLNVRVSPTNMAPGMFRRPFVGDHRAQMHSTGSPHIPSMTDVPKPSDFERGPITAGHERPSPSHAPPNNVSNERRRTFYTNNARDQAAQMMESLHDHIVSTFPGICPMGNADQQTMPNNQDARPHPVSGGRIGKDYDVDEATLKAIVREVMAESQPVTAEVGQIKTGGGKKLKKALAELDLMKARVEELERQPDPSLNARVPGAVPGVIPSLSKAVGAEGEEDPAKAAQAQLVKRLMADATSGDPSLSVPAMQKLQAEITDNDLLAQVLVEAL